jgi:hypothetical protein
MFEYMRLVLEAHSSFSLTLNGRSLQVLILLAFAGQKHKY